LPEAWREAVILDEVVVILSASKSQFATSEASTTDNSDALRSGADDTELTDPRDPEEQPIRERQRPVRVKNIKNFFNLIPPKFDYIFIHATHMPTSYMFLKTSNNRHKSVL